jgi:thiamine-phosphate pyrophosphorylase
VNDLRLHALVRDVETARIAIDGGATVIQLRLPAEPTEAVVECGRALLALCRESAVPLVINDDVRAALELGADGVHLGRTDEGGELARRAGLPLGLSAGNADEARDAERRGAAYVGAGPVWETPSKPDAGPAIGLDGLREICRAVSIPVVAIGGVDASNARACVEAGAVGVAVIRAAADAAAVRVAIDAAR